MSVNWAMVESGTPVELPHEKFEITHKRVGLILEPGETRGGRISVGSGRVYLSRQRVVYLPDEPVTYRVIGKGDKEFLSFSGDRQRMFEAKVETPWFGPNGWRAKVRPTSDGGLEPGNEVWNLKLVFNEGGAFDFADKFSDLSYEEPLPAYSAI
ncbi:hypothetical protein TRVA0_090S00210 [Trichomonascus vanleenenianus]|uniref:uncharacterized protein n=1 Tax=Trichomonascus vanleenenianus TaxID=2268995 RepID=UPI003ECA0DEC